MYGPWILLLRVWRTTTKIPVKNEIKERAEKKWCRGSSTFGEPELFRMADCVRCATQKPKKNQKRCFIFRHSVECWAVEYESFYSRYTFIVEQEKNLELIRVRCECIQWLRTHSGSIVMWKITATNIRIHIFFFALRQLASTCIENGTIENVDHIEWM